MWNYREEYEKLLETLAKDSRPWRPVFNIPKDGTKIYFKCGKGMTSLDLRKELFMMLGIGRIIRKIGIMRVRWMVNSQLVLGIVRL